MFSQNHSNYNNNRACLDYLLIAIRSFTLLCDHSRSKTRVIAIMNLIAKLRIIYATACHASFYTTALDCLSVSCHCRRRALATIYKHGTGRGRWGLPRSASDRDQIFYSTLRSQSIKNKTNHDHEPSS